MDGDSEERVIMMMMIEVNIIHLIPKGELFQDQVNKSVF
jgi:hypothetical protein